MNHLIIYGVITVLAFSFYYLILHANVVVVAQNQIKRDVLHVEMTNEINNASINFNNQNHDLIKIDRSKLFHDLNWTKFFSGFQKYQGSQIYFFIDHWLASISLKDNLKYSLHVDEKFISRKFHLRSSITMLKCIQCIAQSDIENIDLFIKYRSGKVFILCSLSQEEDLSKTLVALNKSLSENLEKSFQVVSEKRSELTISINS